MSKIDNINIHELYAFIYDPNRGCFGCIDSQTFNGTWGRVASRLDETSNAVMSALHNSRLREDIFAEQLKLQTMDVIKELAHMRLIRSRTVNRVLRSFNAQS